VNPVDVVAALHAYGLPGTGHVLPAGPFTDDGFRGLLAAATGGRAEGHLLAAIHDGALPATEAQRLAAVERVARRSDIDLRLERSLLQSVDTLGSIGVDTRVLKGAAAAHLDHDRPWRRAFGDVDLLVRSGDFDIAVGALLAAGHTRRHAELRPGFDRRFTKAACLVRDDGMEVDLHRTFTMGPFGLTVRLDDLWTRAEPFELGGRRLAALCPEHRLLHACYHAALGDVTPRPPTLRDIATLATRALDVALLAEHTSAWQAEAVVSRSLDAAWRYLRLDPHHAMARWAAGLRVTEAQRSALRSYHTAGGGKFASSSIASVRWLPWRDRVGFVSALAFPTRAYRRTTGRTQWDRVHRAVRSVRSRR